MSVLPPQERQFIFRVPLEIADRIRDNQSECNLQFLEQGLVSLRLGASPEPLLGRIHNLPCIVETQKSLDGTNFFKSGDIGQIIIVEPDQTKQPPASTSLTSGLTPPTTDIVNRRWRPTPPADVLAEHEREVLRAIRGGADQLEIEEVDPVIYATAKDTEELLPPAVPIAWRFVNPEKARIAWLNRSAKTSNIPVQPKANQTATPKEVLFDNPTELLAIAPTPKISTKPTLIANPDQSAVNLSPKRTTPSISPPVTNRQTETPVSRQSTLPQSLLPNTALVKQIGVESSSERLTQTPPKIDPVRATSTPTKPIKTVVKNQPKTQASISSFLIKKTVPTVTTKTRTEPSNLFSVPSSVPVEAINLLPSTTSSIRKPISAYSSAELAERTWPLNELWEQKRKALVNCILPPERKLIQEELAQLEANMLDMLESAF
jgi:hypothetical protein